MNLKNQMTSRVKEFTAEANEQLINLKHGTFPKLGKFDRRLYLGTVVAGILTLTTSFAFAADSVFDGILKTIQTYYGDIFNITMALAGLLAVIALILWLVVPSERSAETGKRWFIRILICVGILLALGGIFTVIHNITEGNELDITNVPGMN